MKALRIFVYSFAIVICLAGIAVGIIRWLKAPSKQSEHDKLLRLREAVARGISDDKL